MRRVSITTLALIAGCSAADSGGSSGQPTPEEPAKPSVVADLRADSNRDGEISFDDRDAEKTTWDATHGAIFLANIDDDTRRCKASGTDLDLPKCHDAADEIVNGPEDAKDLARLRTRPWEDAPEDATATIELLDGASEHARLFLRVGPGDVDFDPLPGDGALTLDEIRAGVELAIEAKDIVRDPAVWDGYVTVRLTVTGFGETVEDDVRMRVAPILTSHHLQTAEEIFVSNTGTRGNAETRADLRDACAAAGVPAPTEIDEEDPWTQDFFETAWMSMPAPGGGQHVIQVNLRSANVFDPADKSNPLRPAGRVVFTSMRGPDSAGIQQFDARHDLRSDTLNSFGNFETVPPYTKDGVAYPFGRQLRGGTAGYRPDASFTKMMDAQRMQPAIDLDTSWLAVGHVDETISFVRAKNARGWVVLANDPRMAKSMLEDLVQKGNGATPMFAGKFWYDDDGRRTSAQTTVQEVLADTDVMSASAEAAAEVDAQLAVLRKELGLTDAEIVKVPFLHYSYGGQSIAYQPGTVNGVYIKDDHYVAPRPHGPLVGGKDPFETQLTEALARHGVTVHFAEDWDEYHAALGEVHCGTNARRKVPEAKWWESGR